MLAALALVLFAVAAVVLHRVLGTVFLAITVAYLLVPLQRRLYDRGTNEWVAAAVVTLGTTIAALVPLAGVSYLAIVRLAPVLGFLNDLPDAITVTYFGFSQTFVLAEVISGLVAIVRSTTISLIGSMPIISLKVMLFVILVYALLLRHDEAEAAFLAPVPGEYHDVVNALGQRARETLFAIYVLQAATALGTFVIALPVFMLLGYPFPITLALVAAALQFIPILGPALLLGVLALWKLAVGNVTAALLIVVVGGFFIAWLPDLVIRPRLSRRTAKLPGSLYFIGFIGGLLTVGPIGVVAGPLAIALAVTAMELLTTMEYDREPTPE